MGIHISQTQDTTMVVCAILLSRSYQTGSQYPLIAQLDRARSFYLRCRAFESLWAGHIKEDMKYTQEAIIELAKDVELEDAIDWTSLPIDRDKIYQMIGSQAYEIYVKQSTEEDREAILLATVITLVVENFVLNLQIPGNNIP